MMRIAIVEDSDAVHASLLALLERCPCAHVVGRAVSEPSARRLVESTQPDVVLLDLHLAPGNGLDVLRQMRRDGSTAHVLVVTAHEGDALRLRCIAEGADGYFDKHGDPERLLERLNQLAERLGNTDPAPGTPRPALIEAALDALARRAAELTHCPMAAVSLAGHNRQWMIARSGIDVPCVSRNVSLCVHVHDQLLEIRDTWQDPRLRLNPMLEPPFGIRFYAGAPIRLGDGTQVGVLCAFAPEPGALDETQRDELTRLAGEAAAHIERLQATALVDRARLSNDGPPAHLALGTDPLTGLRRRDALLHGPAPVAGEAMVCIDLDRFSRINHALGREAADRLLVDVARRLNQATDGLVVRLAGDEFAVRLRGPLDEPGLRVVGEAIAVAIAHPIEASGRVVRLRASIGLALADAEGDGSDLFGRADLAMRHAKQAGGNICQLYAAWMGRRAADRVELEEDLRAALARREFVLEYQPLFDLPQRRLVGAEALVRWQHPRRGLVPPDAFIGVAEEIGLIRELGAYVLDAALAQLVQWDALGVEVPRVSVNVSALQLDGGFVKVVEAALARHGLPPARLELEITESALPRDDDAAALLQRLRSLGVALAVDDFGTGYSSLATLRLMPVGTLKIDRHFIRDLGHVAEDAAVVGAIVSMAHSLGMRATAEGVENVQQERCLITLGCDTVQGYRYGRPITAAAFAERFGRASRPAPACSPACAEAAGSTSHPRARAFSESIHDDA